MDQTRFDQLTTVMGRMTRRQAGAGLLAVLTGAVASNEAVAKKKKKPLPPCDPGLTRCGKRCVDLSGDPTHCGSCGKACGKGDPCTAGICVATGLECGAGGSCFVFAADTGSGMTGNLGGLAGADATCQNLASAALLAGTYKAWLADSQTGTVRLRKNKKPYVLVDGTVVARSWTDLTSGKLRHAINLNQHGTDQGIGYSVLTNLRPNGKLVSKNATATCDDWTSDTDGTNTRGYGDASRQSGKWTFKNDGESNCGQPQFTLYCFQQDSVS